MPSPDLLSEAEALARSCVYLQAAGDRYAGVWGGVPPVPAPHRGMRYWLTVDVRYIPDSPWLEAGLLSVFTRGDTGAAVFLEGRALPASPQGGCKLFASARRSLPPVDALFLFGSPAVQEWLSALGWDPEAGYNSNFPEPEPVEAYESVYRAELPLFTGTAYAVLGGWHLPWPEGDWLDLVDSHLLVWTFHEAEPWVEVWSHGDRVWVLERIT